MNKRVKELRKALGLSGEKFGEPIGIKRSAVSQIESGKINLSEQVIKSICLAYHVNEDWLRTGQGDMFTPSDQISLDELIKDADPLDQDICKAYFSIPKEIRQEALQYFMDNLKDE